MKTLPESIPMPLWETGAPGACGNTPEDQPTITPFFPEDYAQKPARGMVLVLPGGGYRFKADHEGAPIAQFFNSRGIPAAVVQYRVAPYRYPYPAEDARRAIRYVRARADQWNILPDHIAILGFSAGGHCAATTATIHESTVLRPDDPVDRQPSRPDALIACYPVIDLEAFRHDGSMHSLLDDENGHVSPQMQHFLSLHNRVNATTSPTFIWSTFEDNAVPVENSLNFAAALHRYKVPCECHIFPHGHHGLGLATQMPGVCQWPELCANWLENMNF